MTKHLRLLEKQEDFYWLKKANEREKIFQPKKALSHKNIWKREGKKGRKNDEFI